METTLALHLGDGKGGGIPRRMRGLAGLHLLGAYHAAGTHFVRGGVDGLRPTARTIAPTVVATAPITAWTAVIAPTVTTPLLAILRLARVAIRRILRRTLLAVLPILTLLLAALLALLSVTSTPSTPSTAVSTLLAVLLLRGGIRATLFRGGLPAGDHRHQLLQKSKCHEYPLKTKGRAWKGNPPRRPVVLRWPYRRTVECD